MGHRRFQRLSRGLENGSISPVNDHPAASDSPTAWGSGGQHATVQAADYKLRDAPAAEPEPRRRRDDDDDDVGGAGVGGQGLGLGGPAEAYAAAARPER